MLKQRNFNFVRSNDFDEFAQFSGGQPHQNGNGGVSPDNIEPDYGYEEEEMDFTPQNGYIADEPDFEQERGVREPSIPLPRIKDQKEPKERYRKI